MATVGIGASLAAHPGAATPAPPHEHDTWQPPDDADEWGAAVPITVRDGGDTITYG